MTQIRNRYTGAIIFEGDCESVAECLRLAIAANANLSSADLRYANLSSADLSSADLRSADLSLTGCLVITAGRRTAYLSPDKMRIGCQNWTHAEWRTRGTEIARENDDAESFAQFWPFLDAAMTACEAIGWTVKTETK